MIQLSVLVLVAVPTVLAYPFVANMPGVDRSMLQARKEHYQRVAPCPFNPVHPGAAKYVAPYLYTHAQHGLPGNGIGGFDVPIPGDPNHQFEAPGPLDIRGPCPGLNTAANYHVCLTLHLIADMMYAAYPANIFVSSSSVMMVLPPSAKWSTPSKTSST